LRDLLIPTNGIANAGLRPEDPIGRRVEIAVASMSAKLARFTSQRERTTFGDDGAESIPAGLHDDVGMASSYETRAQADDKVRESALDLGLLVLAQSGIDKDFGMKIGEKGSKVPDVDRDGVTVRKGLFDAHEIVRPHRMHAFEDRASLEHRIGERHASPR